MYTFWLADYLAVAGRARESREVFERAISYSSDTGLLSEEIEPETRNLLGNCPQGLPLAFIRTAIHIAKGEKLGAEHHAVDFAEART